MATPTQVELFNSLSNGAAQPGAAPCPTNVSESTVRPAAKHQNTAFADAMAAAATRRQTAHSASGVSSHGGRGNYMSYPQMPPQGSPPGPARSAVEEDMEKHSTLLELERLRQSGAKPTRNWVMDDNLDDMQMEARKLNGNIEEAQMVNMMRDFLKLGFTGIEYANTRVRVLELDGWADAVCSDVGKYDAALAKIYRKYWRRTSATPEMELMMGIGTSLFTHHCKVKRDKARRDAEPPRSQSQPPPTSFSMPANDDDTDEEEMPPPGVTSVQIS